MSSLEDEKLWYLCLFGVPYAVVVDFEVVGLRLGVWSVWWGEWCFGGKRGVAFGVAIEGQLL